ncbi:MAG: ATP-binding protein [Cyanobacteriota bacterium]
MLKRLKLNKNYDYISFKSSVARSFSKYIVFLIAIIIVVLFVSIKSQENVFKNNFENSITFITSVLGESIVDATVGNDFIFLENLIHILIHKQQDIVYVIVINDDKKVLISSIDSFVSKNQKELKDGFNLRINSKNSHKVILRKQQEPLFREELNKEKEKIIEEITLLKEEHPLLENYSTYESLRVVLEINNKNLDNLNKFITRIKKEESQEKRSHNKNILSNTIKNKEIEIDNLLNSINLIYNLCDLYSKLTLTEELIQKIPNDNMIYEVSSPIGNSFGIIRIGYSPKHLRSLTNKMYLIMGLIGSLFIFIGFIIVIQLAEERVTLEKTVEIRTKELNESLHQIESVNLHLQEALQHKNRFLNTMSHELRTPLNAVIGFTDMLNHQYFGELNEKQLEYILQIKQGGNHLLSLVNDMLDIAKIDSGSMEFQPEKVSPFELIVEMVSLMQAQYKAKNVTLTLKVQNKNDCVFADKRKFKQIMLNLLSNAIKFTPSGGKVIIFTEKINDKELKILVKDTGCGIKEKDFDKIFSEFYQSDQTRDQALGGTGIGLALCKRLIAMHRGEIGVESQNGNGSTFWFTMTLTD